MSTLWTPDGERPIRRSPEPPPETPPTRQPDPAAQGGVGEPTEAEVRAQMDALARAPAEDVIAAHAFELFQLAAVHLSHDPPQLPQARLAIDAFGALVEGLAGRLGDGEKRLVDWLAEMRMAFVRVSGGPRPPGG